MADCEVPKVAGCAPSGGLLYTICRGSQSGRLCTIRGFIVHYMQGFQKWQIVHLWGGGGGGGLIVHYQGVPIKGLRLDGHASHQCGGHNYM